MKKLYLVLILLGLTIPMANAQEKFDTPWLLTHGKSITWEIQDTADDTSEMIDMYYYQSIQYCFSDTATGGTDNDSLRFSIKLLTSNLTADSTFTLAQTLTSLDTLSGWRPIVAFNVPPSRFGKIVITGITGNSKLSPIYGLIVLCGWSNQPAIENVLR
jgi:hypothetical protein